MPIRAILLDLDDTLLENDMDVFVRKYLPMFAQSVEQYIDPKQFIAVLLAGTRLMIENQDLELTNSEVFWSYFQEATGLNLPEFQSVVERFYENEFPRLRYLTKRKPEAKEIVSYCRDQGLSIVIATNPLFPMSAIEERLCWAGIPVDIFPYALITAYENMHSAKPQLSYYCEILTRVRVQAQDAIMVGNNWDDDILPAYKTGIHTFWLTNNQGAELQDSIPLIGQGSLKAFMDFMKDGRYQSVR